MTNFSSEEYIDTPIEDKSIPQKEAKATVTRVDTISDSPEPQPQPEQTTKLVNFSASNYTDSDKAKSDKPRGDRNNNPGNLEFSDFTKSKGATGSDGRFAIFKTREDGINAARQLLFYSPSYQNLTVSQAIEKYAPSIENNTPGYIKKVVSDIGSNEKLSTYSMSDQNKILNSIFKMEGSKGIYIEPGANDIKKIELDFNRKLEGIDKLNISDNEKEIQKAQLQLAKQEQINAVQSKLVEEDKRTMGERLASNTQLFLRGFAYRPVLGLANMVTKTNMLGEYSDEVAQAMVDNENTIANHLLASNATPDSLRDPAYVGQIAASLSTMYARTTAGFIGGEFTLGALTEAGKSPNATIGDMLMGGVKNVAIATGGMMALGTGKYVFDKGQELVTGISMDARLFAKEIGMSDEKVNEILKGVKKGDAQTLALARASGADGLNLYKKSLVDKEKLRTKLGGIIDFNTGQLNKVAQKGNMNEVKELANTMWTNMEKEVDKSGIIIDASSLGKNIDNVVTMAGGTQEAMNNIQALQNKIAKNPNLKLSELLNIRKTVNYQMNKKVGQQGYDEYNQLKTSLDNLINNNVPEAYSNLIASTNDVYAKYSNQKKLIEILDSVKSKEEVTGHSKVAIDYNKAITLIKEENLSGTIVEQTVETLKLLDKKFNTDFSMMTKTTRQGTNPNEGVLGLYGAAVSVIKDKLWRFGESGKNLAIQHSIQRAIKNADSPVDMVDEIMKSKDLPAEIKKEMLDAFKKVEGLSAKDINKIKMNEMRTFPGRLNLDSGYGQKATKPTDKGTNTGKTLSETIEGKLIKVEETPNKKEAGKLGMDKGYGKEATKSTDKGLQGNKSLGETLQGKTKQVEETPKPTDKSGMGFASSYGQKATKSTDKGVNIGDTPADRLIPVVKQKPVDKQGGLKIAEVGKTTKGTTATPEQKAYFNRFMDDIANPEVSVKNEDFTKVYNMVKNDKDIMYAQSPEKQKLWNELYGALSQAKQQGTVKPALRRYITERLSQYHDMINKGK